MLYGIIDHFLRSSLFCCWKKIQVGALFKGHPRDFDGTHEKRSCCVISKLITFSSGLNFEFAASSQLSRPVQWLWNHSLLCPDQSDTRAVCGAVGKIWASFLALGCFFRPASEDRALGVGAPFLELCGSLSLPTDPFPSLSAADLELSCFAQ